MGSEDQHLQVDSSFRPYSSQAEGFPITLDLTRTHRPPGSEKLGGRQVGNRGIEGRWCGTVVGTCLKA